MPRGQYDRGQSRSARIETGTPVMEGPHITEDAFGPQPAVGHLAPGQNAQLAYPNVAPLRAQIVDEWPSWEVLQAALDQVSVSTPEQRAANTITFDEQGNRVRWVSRHTGQTFMVNGQLQLEVEDYTRYVSLNRQEAIKASTAGRDTDFWNGYTWMRYGYKPERDFVPERRTETAPRLRYEPASPADAAVAHASALRQQAKQTPIPIIQTAEGDASGPTEE